MGVTGYVQLSKCNLQNVLKIHVAFQEHISMRSLVSGSVCLYEIGLQIYEKEYKR